MRTFLAFALLTYALTAPAAAETRNFGIAGFTKVRVDGPFHVSVATGVAPFAKASGSGAALDRVAVEVRGDTLVIQSAASAWGGYPGKDAGPVEIKVGTHELSAAYLNGSGVLDIDRVKGLSFNFAVQGSGNGSIGQAAVDQLTVNVTGTASAMLAGQTGKLTAVVRGISMLDATGLKAKDASLGAEGAATIKAAVSNSTTVDAAGPATVRLTGGPACTLRASGSATVSGCKSAQ